MSEFNEVDNIIEEETPVLHLELEDGTEQDCAVIALFSVEELDDQEYIALITVEEEWNSRIRHCVMWSIDPTYHGSCFIRYIWK